MTIHPLLKIHQVIGDPKRGIQGYIPVSRSAWYAGIKAGLYPQGIKLGQKQALGGDGGIRTLDALLAHTPLAGEHLRPLGHVSVFATESGF